VPPDAPLHLRHAARGLVVAAKPGYAGLRSYTKTRATGTHVGVYDGNEAGMDTYAGRWQMVCEEHGWVISHETLTAALAHAPHPGEWCDRCNGTAPVEAE
jgi:hypothetical protein